MLSARRRAVLEALLPGLDATFDAFLEDFGATGPLPMRVAFTAALELACWVAPLLIGKLPPLTSLSSEDAARALEALGKSRFYLLRQQLLLLKTVCALHYGARADVRERLGIAP